jgi:PAS domain S-box-containing protein
MLQPAAAHDEEVAEQQRQSERWEDLQDLLLSIQESESQVAIQAALQAGHRLTGATLLAIYLLQAEAPGFKRLAGWGAVEFLPDHIPGLEASEFLEPRLWVAGKRATTGLHRAARAARLSYLATDLLGQAGACTGILVVASPDTAFPKDAVPILQILSSAITAIIETQSFKTNLLAERHHLQTTLAIRSAVQEAANEGVIIASPDLIIQEMNPAAETLLGYATQEITGQPVGNVVIGAENLVPALQAAQQGIATPNLGNVHLHRRDGSAFLAHIQTLPVALGDRLAAILVLLRDMSEHEQFQVRNEQLEQRALLGEVTAIFAHEVRNPINNISTGLQLMAMNLAPDDPQQELIARLNGDCDRLTHLMQSILSFTRPPENKLELLDMAELLPHLLERWRPRLVRLNIKPRITSAASEATVYGDLRALEQVFNNLIGNAVQAMSETGGNLSVNIRPVMGPGDRPQVEVGISDNGPGIPDEIRERIFEPFFTTNRNGTGLGLAIAKRIITKHKGTISVSSVPGGTIFQVVLPLAGGRI